VKDVPKSELLITLEAFLISQTSKGKRCLLIVDEAQNLTPKAVEELRMLSNFQFGNQALLQSFLVGQPEFRQILQQPEMEQFRQRVAATCHIGPLDAEETQRYIEHRLKCAGGSGKPSFEPAAFEGIYAASGGIPRRINSVCDRLLLMGFLAGRSELTAADVDEVVREFAQEAAVPVLTRPATAGEGAAPAAGPTLAELDVDLGKLRLEPAEAEAVSRQLTQLTAEQRSDQLQRLERGLLRLERVNVQTLSLLQKLVAAIARPQARADSRPQPQPQSQLQPQPESRPPAPTAPRPDPPAP
ncbi:MAG: AAA family ATPase, partial [Burkholderiales bacterium]|nr:AAA family ATPase [Burkholderiales bacterium]